MVWLLPGAGTRGCGVWSSSPTWLRIGNLAHVIAGTAETLYVVFTGDRGFSEFIVHFLAPAFLGNSVGGVALVAALAHAQHAPQ